MAASVSGLSSFLLLGRPFPSYVCAKRLCMQNLIVLLVLNLKRFIWVSLAEFLTLLVSFLAR